MKLLKPALSFLLFVALIAALPVIISHNGHPDWLIQKFWVLFGFVSIFTFLTVMLVLVIGQVKPQLYAQAFLIGTTVKILFSLLFVLILVTKTPIDRYIFMADFAYIYILNMGFEIYTLLRNLRNQNL
ncbi:hypothetical protein [Mucilaginibacter flavus]|uniref:hypothetical protein n=1 Tax=Mucilaginibacter flavus TaxID=931504 RepID=UPI0025B34069|nr:hypothetical protein [Mucilaginibacter flavus]MDN3584146.1 hypothetical protein [Mucilaginibacter flavus]